MIFHQILPAKKDPLGLPAAVRMMESSRLLFSPVEPLVGAIDEMDLLSPKELTTLLTILSQEEKTLEVLSATYKRTFPKKDQFKVGCAIHIMLQDRLLRSTNTRIVAFFILFDLYSDGELHYNPFLPIFLTTLQSARTRRVVERNFLTVLLGFSPKNRSSVDELASKTTKEIPSSLGDPELSLPPPDIQTLEESYLSERSLTPLLHQSGILPVIADPVEGYASKAGEKKDEIKLDDMLKELRLHSFDPPLVRPKPPLLPPHKDEVLWMTPSVFTHSVIWASSTPDSTQAVELRGMVQKAFRAPLTESEQQFVTSMLDRDAKLVYHCGLTPWKLPGLVENNPLVAIECLLKLMSSSQITEYFSVLVAMDMSINSMEVVNRLTTAVELPGEFIHLYIANCIACCENTADKYNQNRLVRLVCVFLQSLIHNDVVSVKELLLEVQAFCVEFSKIREAAGLFRLLKTLETGDKGGSSLGGEET